MKSEHFLQKLISAKTIAVIGASKREGSPGMYLWDAASSGSFSGRLVPVNPKWKKLGRTPCLPSLDEHPDPIDAAVIAAPMESAIETLERVADAGAHTAVMCTGELPCLGGKSLKFERDLKKAAESLGIRLLGCGSLGIIRPSAGLNLSMRPEMPQAGGIGLVTQSGSITATLCDITSESGFGFSTIIHTGAETDATAADCIDFLAQDSLTRVIAVEISRLTEPRRLFSAIRAACRTKPVIVFWNQDGSDVDARTLQRTLSQCGAVQAHTFREFAGLIEIFSSGVYPRGPKLAVLTCSTTFGRVVASSACRFGAQLCRISQATAQAISEAAPGSFPQYNPIDISLSASPEAFCTCLEALLADDEVDGVVIVAGASFNSNFGKLAQALAPVLRKRTKPVISVMLGQADAADAVQYLRKNRFAAISDPDSAGHFFGHLATFARFRMAMPQASADARPRASYDIEAARRILEHARSRGHFALDEQETKSLLACFGIPAVVGIPAGSAAEAANAARALGFPVALKVRAAGVTSKSDIGGVVLDVQDPEQAREAFEAIRTRTEQEAPFAEFQGVLVERMVRSPDGRELSASIEQDSAFGPMIRFGAGGIFGHAFRDQAAAPAPLSAPEIGQLLDEPAVSAMLGRFRGAPAVNREKLEELLAALSEMARRLPALRSLTIDPILATSEDAIALDAHATVSKAPLAEDTASSHLVFAPVPDTPRRQIETNAGTLLLRPLEVTDAAMEERFLARLSERTAALRFHTAVHKLTPQQIRDFADVDYDRYIAFAAVDESVQPAEIRAVARAGISPDGLEAEFGIVVEDTWQRRGLASVLMSELEKKALTRGVHHLYGLVLRGNTGMERLLDRLGYANEPHPSEPREQVWTLELAPAPARKPRKKVARSLVDDVLQRARETIRARTNN